MNHPKKLGIIQSRGLGDIVIALPIAKEYYDNGYEIHWPICAPFVSHFRKTAPWVHWHSIPMDDVGYFFLDTPMKILKKEGVTKDDDILYMYQYLSAVPEKTDPDFFAMMKFDQYKYAVAGVPFRKKWTLDKCITRNPDRERNLYDKLVKQPRYMVYQQISSDVNYDLDYSFVDPALQRIEITEITDCIFDWLKIIEGAEMLVLIDSVFVNLIDQLGLCDATEKYYVRKWNRSVDGNPVLMGQWGYVPVQPPEGQKVTSLTDLVGKAK